MLSMLYADLRRLWTQKLVCLGFPILVFGYSLFYSVFDKVLMIAFDANPEENVADLNLTLYPSMAAIILGLLATIYITTDFQEGTIRNKILVGAKRRHIYLASCVIAAGMAFVLQLVFSLATILFGNTIFDGFLLSYQQIAEQMAIYALAGVSIAVLFTTLVFLFGNSKAVFVICPAVALVFRIAALVILDKLYPVDGVCKLTGARLHVYTFLDQYCPFMHLMDFKRWDNMSYLLGNLGLIVISMMIGIVSFNRKEMK